MDKNNITEFRESSRTLERNFELLNKSDCCLGNITSAQCHALVEIGRKRDLMLKDLAAILKIDVSTTSKVVEDLVKKDLVNRESSIIDRRSVQINLTDEGFQLFEKIEKDMNQLYEQVYNSIKETEQESLLRTLKIYNQAIERILGNN